MKKPPFAMTKDPSRSRSGAAFDRRTVVAGGLSSLCLAAAGAAPAAAQKAERPPYFRSGPFQFTMIRPERTVPVLRLRRLDGKTIDLAAMPKGPMMINFWATWCAACRTELPILEALHRKLAPRGFHLVAISKDKGDSAGVVARYAKQFGIKSLPLYLDPNDEIAYSDRTNPHNAPLALYGMPVTYLVRRSGVIAGYMPGAADWSTPDGGALLDYLDRT